MIRVLMEVALLFEVAVHIRSAVSSNIRCLSAVEVCHAPHRVWAKDDAPENMRFMVFSLDTSHFEMSPLNDDAE